MIKEEGLFKFLEIIKTAELEESLRHLKHFTMFAPSETAMYCMYIRSLFLTKLDKRILFLNIRCSFIALSNQKLVELQRNQKSARNFVLNHIVTGTYFTDEISSNQVS